MWKYLGVGGEPLNIIIISQSFGSNLLSNMAPSWCGPMFPDSGLYCVWLIIEVSGCANYRNRFQMPNRPQRGSSGDLFNHHGAQYYVHSLGTGH